MLAVYEGSLRWVLKHQGIMLGVFALTLVATAYLFATVSKGFFPQQDTGMVMGVIEGAQDISFVSMATIQKKVGQIVMNDPAVNTMTSFIGSTQNSSQENNGRIFISLKPREKRGPNSSADQVIGRLRKAVSRLGGVNLYMQAMQDIRVGGRLSKTQYIYSLQCPDLDELNQWAPKVLGLSGKSLSSRT
jgi:multidrug efflux pump subunit AcrB